MHDASVPSQHSSEPVTPSTARERKLLGQKQARQRETEKRIAEGRVHTHDGARCKRCKLRVVECQDNTKECSACGANVAVCAEAYHQSQMHCQAATTARKIASRGLERAPSDAIVVMLQAAGVPVEWHSTKVRRITASGPIAICQEAWIQPEAIEIVRADRTLAERVRALARLAESCR